MNQIEFKLTRSSGSELGSRINNAKIESSSRDNLQTNLLQETKPIFYKKPQDQAKVCYKVFEEMKSTRKRKQRYQHSRTPLQRGL